MSFISLNTQKMLQYCYKKCYNNVNLLFYCNKIKYKQKLFHNKSYVCSLEKGKGTKNKIYENIEV